MGRNYVSELLPLTDILYLSGDMSWRARVEWYWQGKTEELGGKPVPVPLCPPQIPHGLTQARTRASVVRGRRLTAWAMSRPEWDVTPHLSSLYCSETDCSLRPSGCRPEPHEGKTYCVSKHVAYPYDYVQRELWRHSLTAKLRVELLSASTVLGNSAKKNAAKYCGSTARRTLQQHCNMKWGL
jgi:hypothetical protein